MNGTKQANFFITSISGLQGLGTNPKNFKRRTACEGLFYYLSDKERTLNKLLSLIIFLVVHIFCFHAFAGETDELLIRPKQISLVGCYSALKTDQTIIEFVKTVPSQVYDCAVRLYYVLIGCPLGPNPNLSQFRYR